MKVLAGFMLIAFVIVGLILGYQFADAGAMCQVYSTDCEWGIRSYLWLSVCILTGIFVFAALLALLRIIDLLERHSTPDSV